MQIMINCREATALVLQGMDRQLKPFERLHLRMHLWICLGCRRFGGQARLMQQATSRWKHYREQEPGAEDSPRQSQ